MLCLDVRRILAATQVSLAADVLAHLKTCKSCARYAEQEAMLSRQISEKLTVAAPEGLASRILLQHGLGEEKRYRMRRNHWQALAASVVLTVGLISGMLMVNYPYSLEAATLAHVDEEKMALQAEGDIQLSRVNDLLAPYNMKLQQAIGRVNFAMPCRIRQYVGAHLVINGEYGKVTVLIMPGEYVMARTTLQEQNMRGLLIPTRGGSIAILGEQQEPLEAIEARINQALIHTA
ncbi:hypothetical protein MNBD_GAMMA25-1401 [hydrothermal vent metagenome]|uniref:Uncharacterized protein n=1 Tax=hydrothermal vent metagenome TaxID=652676 RepID=A0A3B1B891_9ZZZZ